MTPILLAYIHDCLLFKSYDQIDRLIGLVSWICIVFLTQFIINHIIS